MKNRKSDPLDYTRARQHLKLLGFFYIAFGLLGLLNLLGLAMLPLFEKTLAGFHELAEMPPEQKEAVKGMLHLLAISLIILTVVHIFFNSLVGICLMLRRCYSPCFLAGVLTCLAFPLGTVLGIFTLTVLSKPAVKQLFGKEPMQAETDDVSSGRPLPTSA